jgi:hypothetical protein
MRQAAAYGLANKVRYQLLTLKERTAAKNQKPGKLCSVNILSSHSVLVTCQRQNHRKSFDIVLLQWLHLSTELGT